MANHQKSDNPQETKQTFWFFDAVSGIFLMFFFPVWFVLMLTVMPAVDLFKFWFLENNKDKKG